ncbi:MAG: Fic family protein [bacterium]|nr:Fic family protein [bacterium]
MSVGWYSSASPGELLELTHPVLGPYQAFLPHPLPPKIAFEPQTVRQLAKAEHSLGRLSELGQQLPNPDLLTYAFMRREAVLSSEIEGIHTTVAEVYHYEAEPNGHGHGFTREAFNNYDALRFGLEQITHRDLSLGLLRELHARLMHDVRDARGRDKSPGAVRQTQNYIGTPGANIAQASFVPPPPDRVPELLEQWERFARTDDELPILAKIAFAHYQFEAIHPFEDGNGRVGRLLISLMLQREKLLSVPILSLSSYIAVMRQEYYRGLQSVTRLGAWTEWLNYMLTAIQESAEDAIARSQRILELREHYATRVKASTRSRAIELVDFMFERPVFTQAQAILVINVTPQALAGYFRLFVELGLIEETTGRYNNRVYRVPELLGVLG